MRFPLPVPAAALLLSLALAGCDTLPRIDTGAESATGTPPVLVPLAGILAATDATAAMADPAPSLAARAAALRARAAAMRGLPSDPATRARLAQAAG